MIERHGGCQAQGQVKRKRFWLGGVEAHRGRAEPAILHARPQDDHDGGLALLQARNQLLLHGARGRGGAGQKQHQVCVAQRRQVLWQSGPIKGLQARLAGQWPARPPLQPAHDISAHLGGRAQHNHVRRGFGGRAQRAHIQFTQLLDDFA